MYSHIPKLTKRIHEAFAASSAAMKAAHGTRPMHAGAVRDGGATSPVPAPIKTFEEHQSGASGTAKIGGTGPSYRASSTPTRSGPYVVEPELERLAGDEIDRMMVDVSAQRFPSARQTREQRISRAYQDGQSIQQPTLSPEERQLFEARHQQQTLANGAVPQEQGFWRSRIEDIQDLRDGTRNIARNVPLGAAAATGSLMRGLAFSPSAQSYRLLEPLVEPLQRVPEMNERELLALNARVEGLRYAPHPQTYAVVRAIFDGLQAGSVMPEQVTLEAMRAGERISASQIWLMEAANELPRWAQEHYQPLPGWEEHYTNELGQGLGSWVPMLATTVVPWGRAIGATAGGTAGVVMAQGEAIERAFQAGATEEQILEAAWLATAPGLTEMVPFEYLVAMPVFRHAFIRSLGEAATQGVVEGTQEVLQEVMQNTIAYMVYDEQQDLLEGALHSGEVGAGAGLTLGMMRQFVGGLIGARIREPRTVTLGGEQVVIEPRTAGQTDPSQRLGDDLVLDQDPEVLDGSGEWRGRRTIDRNSGRPIFDQLNVPEIGSRACGPTSCAMILADNGVSIDIREFARRSSLDELGTRVPELADALRDSGLPDARHRTRATFENVADAVKNGHPAIVWIRNSDDPTASGHFVVVDAVTRRERQRVVAIRDPWEGRQFFVDANFFTPLMNGNVVFTNPIE